MNPLRIGRGLEQHLSLPLRQRLRRWWRTRVFKSGGQTSCKGNLAAAPGFPTPWLPRPSLSGEAKKLLQKIPADQLVFPKVADKETLLELPGHLDLFSGSRSAARALAQD